MPSSVFICPKCRNSLGEVGSSGVLEAICSGCQYKFQLMQGHVLSATSQLLIHRSGTATQPGSYEQEYELRLQLPSRLEVLGFRLPASKGFTVRPGDALSIVHSMDANVRLELLSISDHTTGERFQLGDVGGKARSRATMMAVLLGVIAAIALGNLVDSPAILVAGSLAVAIGSWFVAAKLLAPVQKIDAGLKAELESRQTLMGKKRQLQLQRTRIEADAASKGTTLERLAELQRKMRAVGLESYKGRSEAIDVAKGTLTAQLDLNRKLLVAYDRAVTMIDIEYETGLAVTALDTDVSSAMSVQFEELEQMESQHSELTRELEANAEVELLLRPQTTGPKKLLP